MASDNLSLSEHAREK